MVSITGAEVFIKHVLGEFSSAVSVGMQLSHDNDGNLTSQDIAFINSLLPE